MSLAGWLIPSTKLSVSPHTANNTCALSLMNCVTRDGSPSASGTECLVNFGACSLPSLVAKGCSAFCKPASIMQIAIVFASMTTCSLSWMTLNPSSVTWLPAPRDCRNSSPIRSPRLDLLMRPALVWVVSGLQSMVLPWSGGSDSPRMLSHVLSPAPTKLAISPTVTLSSPVLWPTRIFWPKHTTFAKLLSPSLTIIPLPSPILRKVPSPPGIRRLTSFASPAYTNVSIAIMSTSNTSQGLPMLWPMMPLIFLTCLMPPFLPILNSVIHRCNLGSCAGCGPGCVLP